MQILKPKASYTFNNKDHDIKNNDENPYNKNYKIIKLTGDMKQNIEQLLLTMDCKCNTRKDFHQVIHAYGQKIGKLREQRGKYKEGLIQQKMNNQNLRQQINEMRKQLKSLEDSYFIVRKQSISKAEYQKVIRQNQFLMKRIQELDQKNIQLQKSYHQMTDQIMKLNYQVDQLKKQNEKMDKKTSKNDSNDSYLLGTSGFLNYNDQVQILQKQNEVLKLKVEKYQKIYRQFNLDYDQIVKVLKQYVQQMPSFSTRQERDLYRMASKMNNNLWKKKLQMQIRDLHQKRLNIKRMQQDFNQKKLKSP